MTKHDYERGAPQVIEPGPSGDFDHASGKMVAPAKSRAPKHRSQLQLLIELLLAVIILLVFL